MAAEAPPQKMLRRKHLNASVEHAPPSPLSNFTVRFSNREAADEFVDISHDIDEAVIVEKPYPPSTLGHFALNNSSTSKAGTSQPIKEYSGPPSPSSTPVVDRVSSFRDNLHNLKERLTSHRKTTDDDREKLLPSASDSSHSGLHAAGSHSPSLIGKLVRKLEERRGSGAHKDSQTGCLSPSKEADVPAAVPSPSELLPVRGETPVKSGSMENIARVTREASVRSTTKNTDNLATNIPQLEPAIQEVANTASHEFLTYPSANRASATRLPLTRSHEIIGNHVENILVRDTGGQFGGVPIRKKDDSDPDVPVSFFALSPFVIVAGILIAIVVVPMPSFMSGLLFGCILTAAASVRIWMTVLFPKKTVDMYRISPGAPSLISGDFYNRLSSYGDKSRSQDANGTWMNQMVGDFDIGTFHVNQTQSVYCNLDGSSLRIRKPKSRVVSRRAMFDEELKSDSFTFVESRLYNIQGATVSLVPADIPRKRRWLWRFPIAIRLVDPVSLATLLEEVREYEMKKAEKNKELEKDEDKLAPAKTGGQKDYFTLYLMPRSDREKEDWYWRFCTAAGQNPPSSLRPNLSQNLSTLNLLFHRVFYDVLTEATWGMLVKKKIQKKLSIIALPYYIEELQITDIDLGKHLPVISDVSQKPAIDRRGIWVEMNFEYHGTVQMTLATKLNLMKLKKENKDGEQDVRSFGGESDVQMDSLSIGSTDSVGPYRPQHREPGQTDREANLYESDEEDEFDADAPMPPEGGGSKIMRYVEKLTESKAFQKLTDVGIVRRAMENVSETDLTLTVVVERLAGRLAINVPHPPSDKLWYGFVAKPELHLKAFPKLGEREVTFDQVTNWIEKKLTSEFHRLITVPNMDDLTVPVMNSGLDDLDFRIAKLSELILR